jgi:hypothetical protein
MRLFFACMLLAALAFPAASADIGGVWIGSVEFKTPDGGTENGDAFAEFKQSGQTITGRAGQSETECAPIENGKLTGTKLYFQVSLPGDSGPRVFTVNMVLVNADKLEGGFEGLTNSGEKVAGKITLDRRK